MYSATSFGTLVYLPGAAGGRPPVPAPLVAKDYRLTPLAPGTPLEDFSSVEPRGPRSIFLYMPLPKYKALHARNCIKNLLTLKFSGCFVSTFNSVVNSLVIFTLF
jgi:hypothetical protein